MKFFGFELFAKKEADYTPSFTTEKDSSAATIEESSLFGDVYSYQLSESFFKTEQDLIKTYRDIALSPEIGLVINEIRNETFIFDSTFNKAVDIKFFDESKLSEPLKEKISIEFDNVYNLLDFKNQGNKLFESWYIDSKIFLHKIIDVENKQAGIKKIIKIDSLKIKKVKEYPAADSNGIYDLSKVKEYYLYSDGFDSNKKLTSNTKGMRISSECITYADSGIYDETKGIVLGHLYKTITPFNNLKLMEESLLIYRVSRSAEKRVFYIDVGNLPKNKAEQYLKEMMNRFRNKLTYDSATGSILDRTNALSMVEDYWLPRRTGGTGGTEITTLPSGDNTGVTNDVIYFKEKFLKSLNVPISRFQDESTSLNYGSTVSEISRDEYRFKKFIDNLRKQFCVIFEDLLKTQLLLKNIITEEDWVIVRSSFNFIFEEDNNFVQSKELEILSKKLGILDAIGQHVGTYFSEDWVFDNVLNFTNEQKDKIKYDIAVKNNPKEKESSNMQLPQTDISNQTLDVLPQDNTAANTNQITL